MLLAQIHLFGNGALFNVGANPRAATLDFTFSDAKLFLNNWDVLFFDDVIARARRRSDQRRSGRKEEMRQSVRNCGQSQAGCPKC